MTAHANFPVVETRSQYLHIGIARLADARMDSRWTRCFARGSRAGPDWGGNREMDVDVYALTDLSENLNALLTTSPAGPEGWSLCGIWLLACRLPGIL